MPGHRVPRLAALLLWAAAALGPRGSGAVVARRSLQAERALEDAAKSDQAAAAGPASFCNPLDLSYRFQPDQPSRREAADPTMVVFKKRYFLFASKSGGYWHSPDLASWTFVKPQGLPLEDYAPTAMAMNGKLYFTASNSQGIWESEDPVSGVWTKVASLSKYWDPSLFLDDDGKVFLTWGCTNALPINVVQLDPSNGWQLVGSPVTTAFGDNKQHGWERFTDWRSKILTERPFIEGSWLNKVGGRYYLQYAAPGTETKAYGDGVFVSDTSPTGPYRRDPQSPASHKPTGFISGAGHGSTFKDLQGRWWHVGTGIVNVRHNMERRVMLYPAYFNGSSFPAYFSAGAKTSSPSLLVDTLFGDFPMRLDQSRPPWQLLSLKKTVTASSTLTQSIAELNREEQGSLWASPPHVQPRSYVPSNAVDEDVRTWWSAATGNAGEWLAVDLGEEATVHGVQVNFADQGSTVLGHLHDAYRYLAEASSDGVAWQPLPALDRRSASRDAPHEYVELNPPVSLRHLRLTSTANAPGGARFSVSGLRLFGTRPGASPPRGVVGVQATRSGPQRARVSWPPADGAQYYVVRFGLAGGPRFHNYQVYDGTSLEVDSLSKGERYSFVVDAVGEGGWTQGAQAADA